MSIKLKEKQEYLESKEEEVVKLRVQLKHAKDQNEDLQKN
jgi:hypothetical protein